MFVLLSKYLGYERMIFVREPIKYCLMVVNSFQLTICKLLHMIGAIWMGLTSINDIYSLIKSTGEKLPRG